MDDEPPARRYDGASPPPLIARPSPPRMSAPPGHIAALRFGRTTGGRALFVTVALILEAAVLLTTAEHADPGHFQGVPGVSAVIIACALAAVSGPLIGTIVAAAAAVGFLIAVAEGATGSWLVLVLWPGIAVLTGLLTDRLLAADAEQAELVARLVESERRQLATQIVGGIGHHFNNQLTVIMGNAELARLRLDEHRDAGTVAALEALRRAGERLATITRLLFILSGGEPPAMAARDASADVRALGDKLADVVAPRRLELALTDEPCPVLLADGALDMLLTELARNATEATPRDATIRIATSRSASEVVLEVADPGRGMAESELRHAFEPFYSTKPPVASTGLGLPVVRAITERAGGRVDLLSRPGQGTAVRVHVPLAPAGHDGGTAAGGVAERQR